MRADLDVTLATKIGHTEQPQPRRRNDTARHRFRHVPYGMWTCRNGSEVLFNRGYSPFLIRSGSVVEGCEHHWVAGIVEARHFYDDHDFNHHTQRAATVRRLLVVLDLFLSGQPIPEQYGWRTR